MGSTEWTDKRLEVIGKIKEARGLKFDDKVTFIHVDEFLHELGDLCLLWDLNLKYLEDQKEEVIEYIYKIIKWN